MNYTSQISDYPFKGTIEQIIGAGSASWWDNAITEIWHAVNWNEITWYNPLSYPAQYRREQIDNIISSYYNLVKNDEKFVIYNAGLANKSDIPVWTLIKKVAQISGQSIELTRKALDQLYFATKDGRIQSSEFLDPRGFKSNQETRETPAEVDSFKNSDIYKAGQGFSKVLGFVMTNIIPIAIIGGGLYVAKKTGVLDKGFAAIKGKVDGKKGLSDRTRKRRGMRDNLFGSEWEKHTYTLYELKENGQLGITGDIKRIKEQHGPTKVKVLYSSGNYDDVVEKQRSYTHTDSLF